MISLDQAHQHIRMLTPLKPWAVPLDEALGLICAAEVRAETNCPTVDSSLKDGFAVLSTDIADASADNPILLTVAGALTAGDDADKLCVKSGTAVRIMTGAAIPPGATAVLASEFAQVRGEQVRATADARPGRNVLHRGSDIVQDQVVLQKGDFLNPAHLGLLAAAGVNEVSCYPVPRVAVAATGSELVMPGEPVTPGKVAASNMVTVAAELQTLGATVSTVLLRDNLEQLQEQFGQLAQQVDVLITCGGVLDGDKDLTMRAMEKIGMEKIFHRVRIGPGKGACMGRVGSTVVFNLPGGPPSNHVAFLLLALPGVRRLMGFADPFPQKKKVMVTEELNGQKDWTQLLYRSINSKNGSLSAVPGSGISRFEAMAAADALIEIPEGCAMIEEGTLAEAWFFR
jgi:molybdopterin molybdotransferase